MNNFRTPFRLNLGPMLTKHIKIILLINLCVFVIQQFDQGLLVQFFSLQPDKVIHQFQIWRLFTYAFLHGSFGHIFFNMFSLWMFGRDVEKSLGEKDFLKYYLLTAIGAGVVHLLFFWSSTTPVIGASGSVFGILVAYALLFPYREVYLLLFFIIPVRLKARTLAILYFVIALYMGIKSNILGVSDGVAHLAHIGGAVTGFVLLRWNAILGKIQNQANQRRTDKINAKIRQENESLAAIKTKVDEILDHINKVGYANISNEEKEELKKASDYLSKMENSRNH